MELFPDDVHSRLQQMAKKDRKRKVFGASVHDYQLNPPLDVEVVEAFSPKQKQTVVATLMRTVQNPKSSAADVIKVSGVFIDIDRANLELLKFVRDSLTSITHSSPRTSPNQA